MNVGGWGSEVVVWGASSEITLRMGEVFPLYGPILRLSGKKPVRIGSRSFSAPDHALPKESGSMREAAIVGQCPVCVSRVGSSSGASSPRAAMTSPRASASTTGSRSVRSWSWGRRHRGPRVVAMALRARGTGCAPSSFTCARVLSRAGHRDARWPFWCRLPQAYQEQVTCGRYGAHPEVNPARPDGAGVEYQDEVRAFPMVVCLEAISLEADFGSGSCSSESSR